MIEICSNPLLLTFELFAKRNDVTVFATTRIGGQSTGHLAGLNIGYNDIEPHDITLQNRLQICSALNLDPKKFTFQHQTHSDHITIVDNANAGAGFYSKAESIEDNDALITSEKGITLFAQSADCVPIAMFDPKKKIAAAIHAGWRGTAQRIAAKTALMMQSTYGCQLTDILVAIGPSIGKCCYEVGDDVADIIKANFSYYDKLITPFNGKYRLDLWQTNKLQLMEVGIAEQNIEIAQCCTKCNSDKFFSARATHGKTGRFGIGICIR